MPRSRFIAALTERLSHRHEQSAVLLETDEESEQWHNELEAHDYNQPYYMLAESIQMLETAVETLQRPQPEIEEIVVIDAHDLASRILPPNISNTLGINTKYPDNVGLEYIAGNPPSLRALHLLLHAYDVTHNPELRHAVSYIIQTCPPSLSELHCEAYQYSIEANTAVFPALQKLAVYRDDKLDEETN